MKILFIGDLREHSRSLQRFNALRDLGYDVVGLSYASKCQTNSVSYTQLPGKALRKLGFPKDEVGINNKILARVKQNKLELIWVEKGLMIRPKTLKLIKAHAPFVKLVCYTNDNMERRHNRSVFFDCSIKYFDYAVIIRGYDKNIFLNKGCAKVITTDRSHDRAMLAHVNKKKYKNEVLFVGTYEKERYALVNYLASKGVKVLVFGNGWPESKLHNLTVTQQPIYGTSFVEEMQRSKIVLNFLRKINNDTTTGRTFEIPACGAFMLAEKSDEHLRLFAEEKEAVFFSTENPRELFEKVRYFLDHDTERASIAMAGRRRCLESGYAHHDRLVQILREIN